MVFTHYKKILPFIFLLAVFIPQKIYAQAPTITSVSSMCAQNGSFLIINGTNLNTLTSVTFGGTPANIIFALAGIALVQVNGGSSGAVVVTNPSGMAAQPGFTYFDISGYAPASAGTGMTVTITGSGFTGATAVSFGGTAASSYLVVSDTQIDAVVGAGTSGNVRVTIPGACTGGTSINSAGFTYLAASAAYSATTFLEAATNTGAVSTTRTVTLTGAVFNAGIANGANFTSGVHYTVANIPPGLTMQIEKTSSNVATISLTGSAIAHANANDVANMEITWNNAALNVVAAGAVTGLNGQMLTVDFTDPYTAAYSSTTFPEAATNVGAITATRTITLTGDTWNTGIPNGTNFTAGVHYSVVNVPGGLAMVIQKTMGNLATISFTGNAVAHANANDVANVQITWNNAAVQSASVAGYTGLNGVMLTCDFNDPYTAAYSGTTFTEAAANDGSVSVTRTITLTGDTWNTGIPNGTDFTAGVHYSVVNVPAGLTMVIEKTAGNLATISFTGNAAAHANANDVANVQITWLDAAVQSASVAGYTGLNGVMLTVDFNDPTTAMYSGTTFAEAAANNGSISATQTVTLSGGTWNPVVVNGTNFTSGMHYTVANVPAGLTMVIEKTSNVLATISFTGNAAAHANANDVTNVQITWLDAALNAVPAASVTGLNGVMLTTDFIDPYTAMYSGTTFAENVANTGTVTATRTITLAGGENWNSGIPNGTNLTSGVHFTVVNVPAGLAMVITKNSATQVTISYTGTATNHANADDVSTVQITFLNAAMQSGAAASVTGLNGQMLTVDFTDPYTAAYSSTTFPEAATNVGAITATRTITLTGDTWNTGIPNGTNFTAGVHYSVVNVPGGLAMVIQKTMGNLATISFTGNAVAHANANDVANVQITWNNAAVQSASVAGYTGLNGVMLTCDFNDPYTAAYSGTTFTEAAANDGSVSVTRTITLTGDTWNTGIANGTNFTAGVHYSVVNVPAGLTMVIEKTAGNLATISFTGNAAAHANANDVANVQITWLDAAVQSASVAGYTGLNGVMLTVDFNDPASAVYSGTTFAEAAPNNGSITATRTITLTSDTWTAGVAIAAAFTSGMHYTVANVPAGLTMVITKTAANTADISFTGNAVAHANVNDVTNVQITWLDAALTINPAASVLGLNGVMLTCDFIDPYTAAYSATTFTEAIANDGSITATQTITLGGGGNWNSGVPNGTNFTNGVHFTVVNVPAALTMVITKNSATQITVSYTGAATNHANADDISTVQITFLNAAMQSGTAGAVTGLNGVNLTIDFNDPGAVAWSGFTFAESVLNTGTVTATQTVTLGTDTWIAAVLNGTNFTAGMHYTVVNVPAGLTMVITKNSAAQATISFTGTAAAHANADDVSNVQITWLNASVTSNNAAGNANLNGQNLTIDYIDPYTAAYSATTFAEAMANDGSITATQTITLTGDNWNPVVVNGTNFTAGMHYNVVNVPAGLTMVIEKTSNNVATISFTGNATNHNNANDVANVQITWLNAAVQSNSVAGYTGLNGVMLTVDFTDPAAVFSGTVFDENVINDGSLTTTRTITISGDSWTGAVPNGTNFTVGMHYNVVNVPAGLTMVITKNSATVITISFTGNAPAHANANDVTNIQITFLNASIAGGNAGIVTGLNGINLTADFFDPGPPTVTSFLPNPAATGTTITINGTNFYSVTGVSFGGVAATSFTTISASQITAVVGAGASGNVSVTTMFGSGFLGGFTYIPPPTITSFTPTSVASTGTVSIVGNNFNGVTAVSFGGIAAQSFTYISPTLIEARVGITGASGLVSVTTPGGTGTKSGFTFIPPPNVTGFSPTSLPTNGVLTIIGSNFTNATTVTLGGVPVTSFSVNSPTQITAIVSTGSSGIIRVNTPGGTHYISGFTYIPPPAITYFTPTTTGANMTVNIFGHNLGSASFVSFGTLPAVSITVISTNHIVAVVGGGASGEIRIITPGGIVSTNGFIYIPTPVIDNISPPGGTLGTTVIITGSNFDGVSQVKFGGVAASSFTFVNSSTITAVVANGATGQVYLLTPGGEAFFNTFTYFDTPTITSFTPTSAGKDMVVVITGTNFKGATEVTFGGIKAKSFSIDSQNQITAIVENGTTGAVVVKTPGGTATKTGFTFIPPPTISMFSPVKASTGTLMTITGTNLTGVNVVTIGGVPAKNITVVSPTTITAEVGDGANGSVFVSNDYGTAFLAGFTYIPPPPTITSFSPDKTSSNATVTITGTNFIDVKEVSFGGIKAKFFTVVSPSQLFAVVASGATGSVMVTTVSGSASKPGYTYELTFPTITGISPTRATEGTLITITGNNLFGANAVYFGGVAATSVTALNNNQITAVVSTGATGDVTVITPNGATTFPGFIFFKDEPKPAILSFVPDSAAQGDVVIIKGLYLTNVTDVSFGGIAAKSFVIDAPTQITAVLSTGASGAIFVTSANGSSSINGFTFIYPPTISSFTPVSAPANSTLVITGTNFSGVTQVTIGGVTARTIRIDSPTQITVTISTAASGSIAVTNRGGTAIVQGFIYIAPPSITNFSPTIAGSGATITITGQNFSNASQVTIGGVSTTFDILSPTVISAKIGKVASGSIFIRTPGGTVSAPGFTFVQPPTITSFTPNRATIDNLVTILGTNFIGVSSVSFGGVQVKSFTTISSTQIRATISTGATGIVQVIATGGTAKAQTMFTFIAPPPTITSFSPQSGGINTKVIVKGTFLDDATVVSFGGIPALQITQISSTEVEAIVGNGASGKVTISTTGGSATSKEDFTFLVPPSITSFAPSIASTGTVVTITGANFTNVSAVQFGGVQAVSFEVVSATLIKATVSSDGASGAVSVTTPGGTATRTGFTFIPPPRITGFSPQQAGTAMLISIVGTNFTGTTSVKLGGIEAKFTIVSPTLITATVGSGASGDVSVQSSGGSSSKAGFVYIPSPQIGEFTPKTGAIGTVITLTGENFADVYAVNIGGVEVPFTKHSDEKITLTIPLGGVNTGNIALISTGGVGLTNEQFVFIPPPKITSSSFVQSRQGIILRINGENFNGTQQVFIGRTLVTFNVIGVSQVTASIPSGAQQTDVVSLFTPGGMATSVPQASIPQIISVSPTRVKPETTVIITGLNLQTTTIASVGGTLVDFTIDNPTQITLTIPKSGASGVIGLYTPVGVLTTTTTLTLITTLPTITTFTPEQGDVGTQIIVTGENFTNVNTVFIGGVEVPFTVDNSSQLTLTIPTKGATSGNIIIASPLGIAVSTRRFLYTPGGVVPPGPVKIEAGTVWCYPNPASESITVVYNIVKTLSVTIRIINNEGKLLLVLPQGTKQAGEHQINVTLLHYSQGPYGVLVETPDSVFSTRFMISR